MAYFAMKLSIVVPIYNVALYVRKCVDSLLYQDMSSTDYEIILVDDGSTDGSAEIADEYANAHPNISVLHKSNGGLSDARNAGVAMAKGEYVLFVDSDDYIEPNVLNSLCDKMETESLDVLRFRYQNVNAQGKLFLPSKYADIFNDYSTSVCDGNTFLHKRMGVGCYAWQFIIKRELAIIPFAVGHYFEDTDWTPRMLIEAQRVCSINMVVYNYLLRDGSITQSVTIEKKRKVADDKLWLIGRLRNLQLSMDYRLEPDNHWFDGMIANTVISLLSYIALNFYEDRDMFFLKLEQLKIYPITFRLLTPAAKRKRLLINISPKLFCFLLHHLH